MQSNTVKKLQPKRTKKVKQIEVMDDDDERELEVAGQSILPNMVEQEVNLSLLHLACKSSTINSNKIIFALFQITISEIEHFSNEEEVVEMDDWLK